MPLSEKSQEKLLVFALVIVFLLVGLVVALFPQLFRSAPALLVLIVAFSLSMAASIVLFYFLHSSANVQRSIYKIGGAAAGFIILFPLLHWKVNAPFIETDRCYALSNSAFSNEMSQIIDSCIKLNTNGNESIKMIAGSTLLKTKRVFQDLALGRYSIDPSELPDYLLPLVDKCQRTYFATQCVLPKTFWNQYWSTDYFNKNVAAIKDRKVDLRRIFIVHPTEDEENKQLLNDLILRHTKSGIDIRLLSPSDPRVVSSGVPLNDILVVDGNITGIMRIDSQRKTYRIEFSTDESEIKERIQWFQRLWSMGQNIGDWIKSIPSESSSRSDASEPARAPDTLRRNEAKHD
ncbi:hypothetical protein JW905_07905 [bacterium]|nr:hypothetical protein [candidate division CSSED10-310 bacterium]